MSVPSTGRPFNGSPASAGAPVFGAAGGFSTSSAPNVPVPVAGGAGTGGARGAGSRTGGGSCRPPLPAPLSGHRGLRAPPAFTGNFTRQDRLEVSLEEAILLGLPGPNLERSPAAHRIAAAPRPGNASFKTALRLLYQPYQPGEFRVH